jgi:hypothetical protein
VFAGGIVSLLGGGCGTSAEVDLAQAVVRDSLGVRIVEHPGIPTDLPMWVVSAEPVVAIGALDGTGPDVFGRIESVAILSDGTLIVADGLDRELRAFDLQGRPLWTAGGRGGGPGEFSSLQGAYASGGDSILAAGGGGIIGVFSSDGEYVRQFRVEAPPDGYPAGPLIVGATALGNPIRTGLAMPQPEPGYYRTSLMVVFYDSNGNRTAEFGPLLHGEGMRRATPDQIAMSVHFGLLMGTLVLMTSCSTGPGEANRQHVVELDRVSDMDCDEPGGWTNLFFAGDPVAQAGSVAVFAEVAPGLPIEVVRRNDDGEIRYSLRIPFRIEEEVLVFTPSRFGRCATAELRLEGVAHPLRIQISTAEEWAYGRIAEYRAGYFSTEGYRTRVEVHAGSRDAIGLNTIEHVEIYIGSDMTNPIRRFSEQLESGEVVFSDQVGEAFLLGRTGFAADSLSTDSRRLFLTEIGDTTLPYRGFVASEFAGTDLGGKAHRLSDHLGQVVVIEFWSTECAFSELARPQANQLAAGLESAGGTYIAMSRELDADMVRAHLEGHPRTSVGLLRDEETWQRWSPETATPLYYVIGSDGRVLMRERGAGAVRLAAAVAGVAIP